MSASSFYGTPNPLMGAQAVPVSSPRAPAGTDLGYGVGQFWIFQPSGQLYFLANIVAGVANWIPVGTGPGSVNTINLVPPAAGNINIVNQGGIGAITVTAPGSGGANSIGLGVNVDGVTIQIIGNQLVAVAAVPALTLTGDVGAAQPYLANNFNIQGGGVSSAIQFSSLAPGQLDAAVLVDNVTIEINASNQLQEIGAASGSGTTGGAVTLDLITFPMGALATVRTFDIMIVGFNTTTPSGVGYEIFGTVRTTGAAAILVGTPDKVLNEEAASITADANLVVSGNNAVVRVTGAAGQTINWRAIFKSISV